MPKAIGTKISWTLEKDELLKKFYPLEGPSDRLQTLLEKSRQAIKVRACNFKLRYRQIVNDPRIEKYRMTWIKRTLTWERELLLRERYPNEGPSEELCLDVGLKKSDVTQLASYLKIKFLKRLEFSARTRTRETDQINFDFFTEWSPNLAYILGYTWADGCLTNHSLTKRGLLRKQLAFCCKSSDRKILEDISKVTGSKYKLWDCSDGKTRMCWTNTQLANYFKKNYHIEERKSYKDLPYPDYARGEYKEHFLRGYFDGDGCFARDGIYLRCSFFGTPIFTNDLKAVLLGELQIRDAKVKDVYPGWAGWEIDEEDREKFNELAILCPGISTVSWEARKDLKKLRRFLYPPGDYLFLERKRKRIENYLRGEAFL